MWTLDWLNALEIVCLIILTGVSIRMTFAAYSDGVKRRLKDLKNHCRFLGFSIVALTFGSLLVGADIAARCFVQVDDMKQKVQRLSVDHKVEIEAIKREHPFWAFSKWNTTDGQN